MMPPLVSVVLALKFALHFVQLYSHLRTLKSVASTLSKNTLTLSVSMQLTAEPAHAG